MKNFLNMLSYSKYVLFHPFDGFYEIKIRDKGNALIATIFIVILGIIDVLTVQYAGFMVNYTDPTRINSLTTFFYSIFPYLLFVIANYSTTTLFDGKGRMREIYIVIGYSLIPVIMTRIIALILSHYITGDEIMLYNILLGAGMAWFAILAFSGLVTIHEYGFFKNIVTLLFTVLAIAIIMFLALLFYSLIQQFISFVVVLYREIVFRVGGWFS